MTGLCGALLIDVPLIILGSDWRSGERSKLQCFMWLSGGMKILRAVSGRQLVDKSLSRNPSSEKRFLIISYSSGAKRNIN